MASLEAKTNPRLRDEVGDLSLVPASRRVAGPTASIVMGAFTHTSPARPSRFSDGTYGVWYCGDRFEVALAETAHHFARFLRATNEGPADAQYRELTADIAGGFVAADESCLDPDDWSPGQAFGARLRAEGADGVVYRSVRWPAGNAAAVFWPDGVRLPVRQGRHLLYHWDGTRMDRWFDHGRGRWYAWP